MATTVGSRQFKINRTAFTHRYDVVSLDGRKEPLYACDVSVFTPGKPDMTLHKGADFGGPVVAVAHMPKFSGNLKIGLGDPSRGDSSMRWEELARESFLHKEYKITLPAPLSASGDDEKAEARANYAARRTFTWKRTHNVAVDGGSPQALSLRNYKLLDDGDQLVAVFTRQLGATSCGTLQINGDLGADFDLTVVMTCLCIEEKIRRRERRSNGGGGGGGP